MSPGGQFYVSPDNADRSASAMERNFDGGRVRLPDDLVVHAASRDVSRAEVGEHTYARIECRREAILERGAWRVRVVVDASLHADAEAFIVEQRLDAHEGDASVRRRRWYRRIPRRGV
jgi:hypothetical protein